MSNFKQQVHDCGLSPQSLTRLLGGNYNTIKSWISGHRTPDPEAVKKLTALSKYINKHFPNKEEK